ncbi:hypothetical protein HYS91_04560 [Candidatus Daviesbacteria bacterium]|nr:hypothetical protein [Candidatus Daviesbacteria bacterium]
MAKRNFGRIAAIGAAGIVLAGAASAAAAVLANKKLRDAFGKKTTEALKTVSDLANNIQVSVGGEEKKSPKKKASRKKVKK